MTDVINEGAAGITATRAALQLARELADECETSLDEEIDEHKEYLRDSLAELEALEADAEVAQ